MMRTDSVSRLPRMLALLALLALWGCAPVKLVSSYDEIADQSLTQLYADTTSFVDQMVSAQGTPAGRYEINKHFYTDASGRADALMARARANQVLGACPTLKLVDRAMEAAGADTVPALNAALPRTGDCQVGLYALLKDNYEVMRQFHAREDGLPAFTRAQWLEGGVGSLLRTAIRVQVAKKIAGEKGDQ